MKSPFAVRLLSVLALTLAITAASIGPAAATARQSTRLAAALNHSSVRVGTRATLTGTLTPKASGRRIWLQRYEHGRWHSLTSHRTSGTGRVAFTLRPATAGRVSYRLRFTGDTMRKAATSPTRRLTAFKVTTRISGAFTHSTVHVAVPTTLAGAISPSLAGRRVYLQRHDSRGWHDVTSTTLTRTSAYTFTVTPTTAGAVVYRATYKGAADATAAATASRTLAVVAASAVNSSGLLGGNINPTAPTGAAGRLTVVEHGPLDVDDIGYGAVPVIVRNNTASTRTDIEVTATVHDSAGKLVATGSSDRSAPATLTSGGVGLAEVDFDHADAIPAGATYSFTVASSAPSSTGNVTLDVAETNHVSDAIVGSATNTTGHTASGPYRVQVFCFAGNSINYTTFDYADQNSDLPAGGTVAFTSSLYGHTCDSYLVGVTAWNF